MLPAKRFEGHRVNDRAGLFLPGFGRVRQLGQDSLQSFHNDLLLLQLIELLTQGCPQSGDVADSAMIATAVAVTNVRRPVNRCTFPLATTSPFD